MNVLLEGGGLNKERKVNKGVVNPHFRFEFHQGWFGAILKLGGGVGLFPFREGFIPKERGLKGFLRN